jgi:phage tail-like protein
MPYKSKQSYASHEPGRDPAQAFRFYVEIEGIFCAEFLECSGLNAERETKQYQEGGVNDHVHILPGRLKYTNIVLKRGITYSRDLWDWFCQGMHDGKVLRKNISIVLGTGDLTKAKHWDVRAAFPVKWTGASLNTKTMDVAAETLELAHHGIGLSEKTENQPLGPG